MATRQLAACDAYTVAQSDPTRRAGVWAATSFWPKHQNAVAGWFCFAVERQQTRKTSGSFQSEVNVGAAAREEPLKAGNARSPSWLEAVFETPSGYRQGQLSGSVAILPAINRRR
jgi:hypothetical protein